MGQTMSVSHYHSPPEWNFFRKFNCW